MISTKQQATKQSVRKGFPFQKASQAVEEAPLWVPLSWEVSAELLPEWPQFWGTASPPEAL